MSFCPGCLPSLMHQKVLCQQEFAIFGKGCTYSLFSENSFASVCLDSSLEAADLCFISLVFKHWSLASPWEGEGKIYHLASFRSHRSTGLLADSCWEPGAVSTHIPPLCSPRVIKTKLALYPRYRKCVLCFSILPSNPWISTM